MWKKYYSGASGLLGLKIKSKNKKSVIKFVNSLNYLDMVIVGVALKVLLYIKTFENKEIENF